MIASIRGRSFGVGLALSIGAFAGVVPAPAATTDLRSLPMHFELRQEGPAQSCDKHCRTWVSAVGAITADTPKDFETFLQGRDLRGATIALDSDGGSVLGAIALGRDIRRLDMTTMVGKTVDVGAGNGSNGPRAELQPKADCESMCTFVLLGGTKRFVPPEARVMVHQIWLGDRRDDPTAASYSAEDLVLVQRDIGRLAQYTADMGGAMELLDLALRIPPWEPMRTLTRDELRRVRLDTTSDPFDRAPAVVATNSAPAQAASISLTRPSRITERAWAMIDNGDGASLARRHPLTVEGDTIGSFDLSVACADGAADRYVVTYKETRRGSDAEHAPPALRGVSVYVGQKWTPLDLVSSARGTDPAELETVARGVIPGDLIKTFVGPGNRSLTIATTSAGTDTSIRIGNTGVGRNFPVLSADCTKTRKAEARLQPKASGMAQAGQ